MSNATAADPIIDCAPEATYDSSESSRDEARDALLKALDDSEPIQEVEVLFLDRSLRDLDGVMAELGPDVAVLILDPNADGVEQMAQVLAGYSNVSAVHVMTLGSSRESQFGSISLRAGSITGEHAEGMAMIAASLSGKADILIYNRDVGTSTAGLAAMQALANATVLNMTQKKARVLLVEDDKDLRRFLVMALEMAGHNVTAFGDGASAFEEVKQVAFDLLLTDIAMPDMDGIELARRAAEFDPSLKIMFITAYAAVAHNPGSIVSKEAKVLSKPFCLKDLVDEVNRLMAA